jgi:hypothetical protein
LVKNISPDENPLVAEKNTKCRASQCRKGTGQPEEKGIGIKSARKSTADNAFVAQSAFNLREARSADVGVGVKKKEHGSGGGLRAKVHLRGAVGHRCTNDLRARSRCYRERCVLATAVRDDDFMPN